MIPPSRDAEPKRGRPPLISDDKLKSIIGRHGQISRTELRQITGQKKSTLAMQLDRLLRRGETKERKTRDGKTTHSIVSLIDYWVPKVLVIRPKDFKPPNSQDQEIKIKKGVVDVSKLSESQKNKIDTPEFSSNIIIATTVKKYLQEVGAQEDLILRLVPVITGGEDLREHPSNGQLSSIPPLERQIAQSIKKYIREEHGQEALVLTLIPAMQLLDDAIWHLIDDDSS